MYYINPKKHFSKLNQDYLLINNEETGKWFFRDGIPELSLIHWCEQNFIDKNKVFLDIGAHIGTYSWILGKKSKLVHSFECNPEVYNCLCANVYLKGMSKKIIPHRIGLSNKSGKETYFLRSTDGGGNGFTYRNDSNKVEKMELKVKTLDSYNFKDVGFIKIDVEGHELEVLQGAKETLKNNNYPNFIFESWGYRKDKETNQQNEKLRKELFEYIKSELKYKIVNIAGYKEMFLAVKDNKSPNLRL